MRYFLLKKKEHAVDVTHRGRHKGVAENRPGAPPWLPRTRYQLSGTCLHLVGL